MGYSVSIEDRRHPEKSVLLGTSHLSRLSLTRGSLALGAGVVLALIALAFAAFVSVGV